MDILQVKKRIIHQLFWYFSCIRLMDYWSLIELVKDPVVNMGTFIWLVQFTPINRDFFSKNTIKGKLRLTDLTNMYNVHVHHCLKRDFQG